MEGITEVSRIAIGILAALNVLVVLFIIFWNLKK